MFGIDEKDSLKPLKDRIRRLQKKKPRYCNCNQKSKS